MNKANFKQVTEKELNICVSEQNLQGHTITVCEPPVTIFFCPESQNIYDAIAKIEHDYDINTGVHKPTYWLKIYS